MPFPRLAALTAAALFTLVSAAPALAQQQETLSVDPVTDSVLATGLPYGDTTVKVTRPDALTGAPVVTGSYETTASGLLPVSVNMTVPTAFNPSGDCWQAGALTLPDGLGLTPDIRPGDTVTVTGGLTLTVPPDGDTGTAAGGPIPGCDALTDYGRNAITAATLNAGAIAVTAQAQPLTSGVSISAGDGQASTAPVDATLGADGTWTATIPADQVATLADGTLTVNGVYTVPDVSTGTPAHVTGVPATVQKQTAAVAPTPTPAAPSPAAPAPAAPVAPVAVGPAPPASAGPGRLGSVRATARLSLASARHGGIRVSFVVPAGTKVIRVRLARAGRTAYLRVLSAGRPGTRQTVRITGASRLTRGTYTLTVAGGTTRAQLGPAVKNTVKVS